MVANKDLEQQIKTLVTSVGDLTLSVEASKTELSGKIDKISERLDGYDKKLDDIEKKIQDTDDRVGTLAAQIGNTDDANRKTFADLNKRIADLEAKLKDLQNVPDEMNQLAEKIESRTNRQLRETLVIKNVPEMEENESYDATKKLLANLISDNCDGITYDEAFGQIKRAHREANRPPSDGEEHYRKGKRHIFAALHSWDLCQVILKTFQQKCINDRNFPISVEQKYGPMTTKRRQMALQLRKELIESGNITSGFLEFPAKLLVNYPGDVRTTNNGDKKVYKLHTNFSRHEV